MPTHIVGIAIIRVAAHPGRVANIRKIHEDRARSAFIIARLGANNKQQILILMDNDVVAATRARHIREVGSHVLVRIELDRLLGIDVKQLLHVEDLNAVVEHLGADNHVVFVGPDLLPEGTTLDGHRYGTTSNSR